MYAKAGQAGVLIAHFVATGAAATGLTVTGKVWEISDANVKSPNDTTGTTLTVTEIGGGLYKAPYTMSADGAPIASFATTGTADVKSVPASFVHLGTLDTLVTAVGDVHATDLPAIASMLTDIHGTDLPAVKADTAAVKTKTDNLPASPAAVGSNMGTVSSVTGAVASVTGAVGSVTGAVGSVTGNVGGNVVGTVAGVTPYAGTPPTPPSAADIKTAIEAAGSHLTLIKAKTDNLPADTNTLLVTTGIKAATVPAVVVTTNNDKTGYALTVAPPTTAQIEAALLNEGDASALLQAIADKVSGDWSAGDVSAASVASAVRTNLATELANLDTAVSTRLATTGYTAPPSVATIGIDTARIAALMENTGGVGGYDRFTAAALETAPTDGSAPTADAIADEVQTRTIARVTLVDTTTTNTDMRGTDGAIASLTGIATATNVADGADEVIAALPAAAPSAADNATAVWGTAIKAVTAIPAVTDATLSIAYDHAKDDTLGAIGALNDFDHATDVVAHVTLVDTTTVNTDMVSEPPTMVDISGLSTFDPALNTVAHVTLVDTTTTNTDMVAAAPSIADLPTNLELVSAIADLVHVDAAPDISGLSTFNPTTETVTLGVAYDHAKDDVLTGIAGLSAVQSAPDISGLATSLQVAALNHVDAAPDISGLATKTEVLALSPVTAAADPADVAALILTTPANKLATNVDGSVNADATVDTAAIASDVVDALEVAGIPTLGVIEASTVLAMKADVEAIQAPTFSGTVTFDGTVDASVDMTPVTEAIAAIPAPTFDGTVTFSGTVSAPSVTVNPTVLSTGERAAIAAVTNTLITTNHGTGTYGSATLAAGVTITPATLDTDGVALGRVMPYGRVTVYHGEDAEYVFYADADGDYSYELPEGSGWTLLARHAGYEDTSAEVSTEGVS